jgi:glutamate-1-semialdehyde aminotransferase
MAGAGNGQPNAGIPKCLSKKIAPFELDADLSNIAAVVLEPALFTTDFLEEACRMTYDADVPMIYDEITSGFRERVGGIYLDKKYNYDPDIVVYGKALGNGYPICAIVGNEVMEGFDKTFISSTFNTERTGFAAGLATLEYMVKHNVQDTLIENGKFVKSIWYEAAKKNGIELFITGLDALATFTFVEKTDSTTRANDHLATLYQQEMVKKGFLAGSQYYASIAHKRPYMLEFEEAVKSTFEDIACNKIKLEGRVATGGVKHG